MYSTIELVGKSLLPKTRSNSVFVEIYDGKNIYIENSRKHKSIKITFMEFKDNNQYGVFIEYSICKPNEFFIINEIENIIKIGHVKLKVELQNDILCFVSIPDEIEFFE